ncbi:UNVERIFIED_CONTAM: hypothetical protein HDU68_004403, partial [Siphonaria sp. JEL0065]
LSLCALAARMQIPLIDQTVSHSYFEKARKALARSQTGPSVKKVQALVIQSSFTVMVYGNPNSARLIFSDAVQMMAVLRLNVDPDDSPWLKHLNLTEEEKNERRILFWVIFYNLRIVEIVKSHHGPKLDIHSVKPAKQLVMDGFSSVAYADRPVATLWYICVMIDIILDSTSTIKAMPQSSNLNFLDNAHISLYQKRIEDLKESIPHELLLLVQDQTLHRFLNLPRQHLSQLRIVDMLMVTMLYNSAICIIHRPCLYLTSFLSLTSPQLLVPDNLSKLLLTLETCISAARTITALNTWILNLPDDFAVIPGMTAFRLRYAIFLEHSFTYFALFESAVVLWFVTTKTQTFWWRNTSQVGGILSMTIQDRQILRSEVLDLLKTLSQLESHHPEQITPLVKCVTGMVQDMENTENSPTRRNLEADEIDIVILGMKDLLVSESPSFEQQTDVPWVFLGLLGVDVERMRWN